MTFRLFLQLAGKKIALPSPFTCRPLSKANSRQSWDFSPTRLPITLQYLLLFPFPQHSSIIRPWLLLFSPLAPYTVKQCHLSPFPPSPSIFFKRPFSCPPFPLPRSIGPSGFSKEMSSCPAKAARQCPHLFLPFSPRLSFLFCFFPHHWSEKEWLPLPFPATSDFTPPPRSPVISPLFHSRLLTAPCSELPLRHLNLPPLP